MTEHILSLSCPDRPGLVAAISGLLANVGANITEAQQYEDADSHQFFARLAFDLNGADETALREHVHRLATQHNMSWKLRSSEQAYKVVLMVSKFDHCLNDLLYRNRIGELPMEIAAIVSNHPKNGILSATYNDFPFYHIPVTRDTKPRQEEKIKQIIESVGANLIVLARYMQILSEDLAEFLAGRCINIHHSFLPSFKGARPYHQAHTRGVKIIGATAHYVTSDLDEGPIISQDVEHISHTDKPDDLVRKGRDIERRVLARAVAWHLQDRVFINGKKTVVFRD